MLIYKFIFIFLIDFNHNLIILITFLYYFVQKLCSRWSKIIFTEKIFVTNYCDLLPSLKAILSYFLYTVQKFSRYFRQKFVIFYFTKATSKF